MIKQKELIDLIKDFKKKTIAVEQKKIYKKTSLKNYYLKLQKNKKGTYNFSICYRPQNFKKIANVELEIINNNYKIKNLDEITKSIKKYEKEKDNIKIKLKDLEEDFINYLKKNNIKEITKQRYVKYFRKITDILKNKEIELSEKGIIYLLKIYKNNIARAAGVSKKNSKQNCYAVKNANVVLKHLYRFLLEQEIINKKYYNKLKQINYKDYFNECNKQKTTNLQHYKTLQQAQQLYEFLLDSKRVCFCYLQQKYNLDFYILENYDCENYEIKGELLEMLQYKQNKISKYNVLSYLYKILILEFIMLTGIRSSDFFSTKEQNIKNGEVTINLDDKNEEYVIIFRNSKTGEYILYLTYYLQHLFNLILEVGEEYAKAAKNKPDNSFFIKQKKLLKEKYIKINKSSLNNFVNMFLNKKKKFNISLHGFRHTFKNICMNYISLEGLDKITELQLGHALQGIEKHYFTNKNLKEKRLQLLEQYRQILIEGKEEIFYSVDFGENLDNRITEEILDFVKKMYKNYKVGINVIKQKLEEITELNNIDNIKQIDKKTEEYFKNFCLNEAIEELFKRKI